MATKTKSNGSKMQKLHDLPDLGLSKDEHEGVVQVLMTVLADAHVLYIKLRKFHWNVTGPQFHALHVTFEEQYTAIADTIDEIAEFIVQYGAVAPGTMEEFVKMARLKEQSGDVPEAHDMVAEIVADHEAVIRHLREDIETVGSKYEDVASEDFLTGLLEKHQKQAWMARSMIKGKSVN